MSNRKNILLAIANDPATVADLADVTGWPMRKVRDTLGDLKNVGLAVARRDDITGHPLYAITPAGREWLEGKTQAAEPAPAVVKDSLTVADHVGDANKMVKPTIASRKQPDIYADGLVIEMKHANPDGGAHYTNPPFTKPQLTQPEESAEQLRRSLEAQKMTIEAMRMRMAMLEQEVEEKAQRIAALESNAELPLGTRTERPRYALTFQSELHESPEAAMAEALQEYDAAGLDLAIIVACEPVGKIELRPVLVPA